MYDGFTLFERFFKNSRAIFVKNYLEDRGIRVILHLSNIPFGGFRTTFAAHMLFVLKEDFEKAQRIYEEFKEEEAVEYDHEYTDEEFEELAVNAKFEDYDEDSFTNNEKLAANAKFEERKIKSYKNTEELAQPSRSDENYQKTDIVSEVDESDEPYYRRDIGLSMSKDLIRARVDQELDENKVYKCPNCADKFLEQQKMEGGMKFLFTINYLFILVLIIAYLATAGQTEETFAKNLIKILPLNIIIAVYHIISVSTSKYRCEDCGHVEKH